MDAFTRSLAAATLVDGKGFALPGIGSIEGRYVPARINHVRRVVEPPVLDIHWSSPALATIPTFAELLIRTGATHAEAYAIQEEWLAELAAGQSIPLGDLGELKRDQESAKVTFVRNATGLERVYWSSGAVDVEPLPRRARLPNDAAPQSSQTRSIPEAVAPTPAPSTAVPISATPQIVAATPSAEQPSTVEGLETERSVPMPRERSEVPTAEPSLGLKSSTSPAGLESGHPLAGSDDSDVSAGRAEGIPPAGVEEPQPNLNSVQSRHPSPTPANASTPTGQVKSLHQVLAKAEDENRTRSTEGTPPPSPSLDSPATSDWDEASEAAFEEDEGTREASTRDSFLSALPGWWRYAAIAIGALLSWVILRQILGADADAGANGRALTISQDRLNRSPLDGDAGPSEGEGVVSEDFVAPSYNPKYGPASGERSARIDDESDRYATLDVPVVPAPVPQMRAPNDTRTGVGAATPASPGAGGYSVGASRPPVTSATNGASKSTVREAAPKIAPGFDPASLAGAPTKSGAGNGEVEVVIILGSFSDAINAGRLTERLAADGLLPFVDQPGKLTRVGVSFTATKAREVDRMLERMQRDYNPNAWVLE